MEKLKILMAGTEAYPFIKSGGLGDVLGSLPQAFNAKDVDVRVILPKYQDIPKKYSDNFKFLDLFYVRVGSADQYVGLFEYVMDGVTFYFVDNEHFFKRPGLYGYYDDAERFVYFSRAVLEAIPYLGFYPDILHAHDWQTAVIPFLLKEQYGWHYLNTKSVFTIHNIKYQGLYGFDDVKGILNLDYFPTPMEYFRKVNFMKGALYTADMVTTVSPTYAQELKDPYYGEGLDGVVRDIDYKLTGILNGIDNKLYNPQRDEAIFVPFTRSYKKKLENKTALQAQLALPVREEVPVISMISRLVEQKGLDLIAGVIHEILQMDVQLVFLGTGDGYYEKLLTDVANIYPEKVRTMIDFNDELSRKIYAGSDMFLMPSKFEPCGLSQMISMRYGTIPIVRETGGLVDTVKYYNPETGEGNGFSFATYNAHDMLFTIQKAVGVYYDDKQRWQNLFQNAVKSDFDWRHSAETYLYYYKKLAGRI